MKHTMKLIRAGLLLLAVALVSCGKKESRQLPLGTVQRGTFYVDLYEEGEVEAVNSTHINAPMISWRYGNLKITELVKDGQEVKAGDTLIVFDPSEVQKGIVEAEGRVEIARAELEKMLAQQQSDLEELRAEYEVTRLSQEISHIQFESAAYESEIKKKEIQLTLEQADISLTRAGEQIDNRVKIQREEVKQKRLAITQDETRLREAYETLDRLHVTTPSPGIAIISHNWNSGSKFQLGDQCWPGSPLIELPDLSRLKATVKINEVDISKITRGLQVEIKPDAFSDSLFTGEVISVANLAVSKDDNSKIKVFPVEIQINETDENLLPGLTVSCRIIIDRMDDVLYVPLEALHTEGGRNYVYRKTSGGYDRVEVQTGQTNADYVILTAGLDEGDRIALGDPYRESGEEGVANKEE